MHDAEVLGGKIERSPSNRRSHYAVNDDTYKCLTHVGPSRGALLFETKVAFMVARMYTSSMVLRYSSSVGRRRGAPM